MDDLDQALNDLEQAYLVHARNASDLDNNTVSKVQSIIDKSGFSQADIADAWSPAVPTESGSAAAFGCDPRERRDVR